MSKAPELLPLGSAVTITDDATVYIIIARGFQKPDDGFVAGYKAVPHPAGAGPGVREIVIRGTQVDKVLHRGFENPDDVVFATNQLTKAKAPPVAQAPAAEPEMTVDLARPAVVPAIPPRPPTDQQDLGGAMKYPKDPFRELRSKGKRK